MTNTVILEKDIIKFIKQEKPSISNTDLKWRLFRYCKENELHNIGSQQFVKSVHVYNYELGEEAQKINLRLFTDFPDMKIVIWESRILNEWLNLLLAKNTIFVEVEKEFLDTIYDTLAEMFPDNMILVNPKIDEYYRYQRDGMIVLRTLIARAPVSKENHITLEKLFVDLTCDKLLTELFDKYSVNELIQNAGQEYAVNEKKLLAYARRRGKYNYVLSRWREIND